MKIVILAVLSAVAAAAPQSYGASPSRPDAQQVPILRDDRVIEDDGRYNFDVETGNGILLSESGSPGSEGAINSAGRFSLKRSEQKVAQVQQVRFIHSYTAPDGTPVQVQFVADENGFQPQSDLLPVAPEFPHPIPDFVLEQIAFAAQEDARRPQDTSGSYGQ
ncbi:cuticle protein AMP1A-like [Penaeus chinensis]|uniref:cuticle protein AMP1A-like n=1 Tax=Penaeus chinensis TaxID=139456 RepID=UPI001FB7D16A|nr:cuticle protein AMP1A-like [Penaeus chinensis]